MTTTSTNLLRHVRQLAAKRAFDQWTDQQLLERFAAGRDEAMFALLVRRHGPMVLGLCRRLLGHEQDAEDAFQAAFLLLARKMSSIRQTDVGGWLYRVAYHVAVRARVQTAKRRQREQCGQAVSPADPLIEAAWKELRQVVDEELHRLPEAPRSALVLCYLEGKTQEEAARLLGWSKGTLRRRLDQGRELLRTRLLRRGLAPAVALSGSLLVETTAAAAVSAVLADATVQAVVSGTASPGVTAMVEAARALVSVGKIKAGTAILLVTSLLSGAGVYFLASPQRQPGQPLPALRAGENPRSANHEVANTVNIQGHVLDPDGKPAMGARVYVDPQAVDEKPPASATTEKDGHFSLRIPRSRLVDPATRFSLRRIRILATAKGRGLDWLDLSLDDAGKEATLRLVKDDVPIEGRILSLEGKPLAGIKVRIQAIEAFPRGDFDRALDAKRKGNQISESTEVHFLWYRHHLPDSVLMAITGADGRFRLEGIGRERIVTLNVEGPGIHYSQMQTMTRRADSVRGPYKKGDTLYGATFDYFVKPARLIRGTVREKGTGKPLAGIRIRYWGYVDYVTAEAVSDKQGRYELPGCPKGDRYGFTAAPSHSAPYFGANIVIQDTPGMEPLAVDLELVRGILCEGKVLDETGQTVPGEVSYSPLHPNPNVPNDLGMGRINVDPVSTAAVQADGTFRCVVLPGCGCLAFRAEEPNRYQQACVDPRTIKAKGDKRYLFACSAGTNALLPQERFQAIGLINPDKNTAKVSEILRVGVARPIHGTVLDADGKPLVGVRVRGLERGEGWETLASEKYTVRGINPLRPRRLYFLHDARRLIGSVVIKGTETKPVTVTMQPWAGVRGRLLDKEGNPLRNTRVHGSEIVLEDNGSGFVLEDRRTDGEGRFRLDGLVPGLRYDLYYVNPKSSISESFHKKYVGKPGEVHDLGDMRVQPPSED